MLKIVAGLILGIVAAFAAAFGFDYLAHALFPGVTPSTPAAAIPVGMQVFIIIAYFLSTLIGALVGGRVAERRWVAWAVALVVTASAVATIFLPEMDQPLLTKIAGVIAPLLAGYVASRMVTERTVDTATADAEV